jgi:polysaccharide biosynthesis/export protein
MTGAIERMPERVRSLIGAGALAAAGLAGCATPPQWVATSGPSRQQLVEATRLAASAPVRLVDVDDAQVRRLAARQEPGSFAEQFTEPAAMVAAVGYGDGLEISVWEAPPALLFGAGSLDARASARPSATTFGEQVIGVDGTIQVPFAGAIAAAGRTTQQIGAEITRRLTGRANQPQVLVRVTRNVTATVTVVGEVLRSMRMPLTARGERLLDAIAEAGGARQPVDKVTVQLTRGERVAALPLDQVIRRPRENVTLAPGDVVTVQFQPLSLTALGATGRNAEIPFEAQGITLAQALARAGGVQDARSDARGVFVFRFEDPQVLEGGAAGGPVTPDGRVPVVYRVDLTDPTAFLVAQGFPMRNKDVIYVANAPSAEIQKFLNILTATVFAAQGLGSLGK